MRVRSNIADSGSLTKKLTNMDLDYLLAGLHGRRSRMAEGITLDNLCRIPNLAELTSSIFPRSEESDIFGFQRRITNTLADELSRFHSYLSGPGANLIRWILGRFQLENIKMLLRLRLAKRPTEDLLQYLIPLPEEMALSAQELVSAQSTEEFIRLVPQGLFRECLQEAAVAYGVQAKPYFYEISLDRCYLRELIARSEHLAGEDREMITPMILQEADIFHLMLILRGKFHYGLTKQALLPLHIAGTGISRVLFSSMMDDKDLRSSIVRLAAGYVFGTPFPESLSDSGSVNTTFDATVLERMAWKRFLHLANLAFRQSHMGLGAVVGYTGIRRIEVANLITISEGIRKGLAADAIYTRLVKTAHGGVAHV